MSLYPSPRQRLHRPPCQRSRTLRLLIPPPASLPHRSLIPPPHSPSNLRINPSLKQNPPRNQKRLLNPRLNRSLRQNPPRNQPLRQTLNPSSPPHPPSGIMRRRTSNILTSRPRLLLGLLSSAPRRLAPPNRLLEASLIERRQPPSPRSHHCRPLPQSQNRSRKHRRRPRQASPVIRRAPSKPHRFRINPSRRPRAPGARLKKRLHRRRLDQSPLRRLIRSPAPNPLCGLRRRPRRRFGWNPVHRCRQSGWNRAPHPRRRPCRPLTWLAVLILHRRQRRLVASNQRLRPSQTPFPHPLGIHLLRRSHQHPVPRIRSLSSRKTLLGLRLTSAATSRRSPAG